MNVDLGVQVRVKHSDKQWKMMHVTSQLAGRQRNDFVQGAKRTKWAH